MTGLAHQEPTTDFLLPLSHPQGQHYEEEKRALSHEIVALNSHLLEAKVTIDKLSEDNVSAAHTWPVEGCWWAQARASQDALGVTV